MSEKISLDSSEKTYENGNQKFQLVQRILYTIMYPKYKKRISKFLT